MHFIDDYKVIMIMATKFIATFNFIVIVIY